jgi:GNAT superfamily N-acetyltransferase
VIRSATTADVPAILGLVRDLAEYERGLHEVHATEERLHAALFGERPAVFCDIAEVDGEVAGFALWFLNFSTWLGRHGIYLEDLYVRPERRRDGIGRALLVRLAQRCVEHGYGRLEWSVLDWNEPALGFYRSIGALPMDEWTVHRLSGDALTELARGGAR